MKNILIQSTLSFPKGFMHNRIRKFPFLGKGWATFPNPRFALVSVA
jgi:hypothetical protein